MPKHPEHHSRRSVLQASALIAGLKVLPIELPAAVAAQLAADGIQDATGWEGAAPGSKPESVLTTEANTFAQTTEETEALSIPTTNQDLAAIVIAPILEEAVFRALPSFILTKTAGPHERRKEKHIGLSNPELATGIATSTIFAAAHIPRNRSMGAKNRAPAAQFITGMCGCRLQRRNGFGANVAMHSGHNAVAVGITKLASRARRPY